MKLSGLLAVALLVGACSAAQTPAPTVVATPSGAAATTIPATAVPTPLPALTAAPAAIQDTLPIVLTSTAQRFKVPNGTYAVAWSVAPGTTTDCKFSVLALGASLSGGALFSVTLVGQGEMKGNSEIELVANTYTLRHSEYDENAVDDCVRDWSATITAK